MFFLLQSFPGKGSRRKLHPEVKDALARHIAAAIDRIDPSRYAQEPNYMAALIGKLDGVVYLGKLGRLELQGTVVNDRGPGAAENKAGADFAIIANVQGADGTTTNKAVLGQAKRGAVEELGGAEVGRLAAQIAQMRARTRHYVIVETPVQLGSTVSVLRSKPRTEDALYTDETLTDYLEKLVVCTHGDRRTSFVSAVKDSKLSTLRVSYRTWSTQQADGI